MLSRLALDAVFLLVALLTSPIWLYRMIRTGKIRTDWAARLGRVPADSRLDNRPQGRAHDDTCNNRHDDLTAAHTHRLRLLLHGVSVGEVNALQSLIDNLKVDFDLVIAATTDTGFARAKTVYGAQFPVVRYPFDFSWSVRRFLDAVRPDVVALVELEVWPNFVTACSRRGIPVAVINGRISDRSISRYRLAKPVLRSIFRQLAAVAAQDQVIADRFIELGARPQRVTVVGTMKWDNAPADHAQHDHAGLELADLMHIRRDRLLVVAGSTGPGEEMLIDQAVPREGVQLLIAPRKPERFNEVAQILGAGVVRRSRQSDAAIAGTFVPESATRFLLDSIGELRAAYALADLVIIGRSFCAQGGSDMIEAAGLGKPVIIGPDTANFAEVAAVFIREQAVVQVSPEDLASTVRRLLDSPEERQMLADRALSVIARHRGATARQADILRHLLMEQPVTGSAVMRAHT